MNRCSNDRTDLAAFTRATDEEIQEAVHYAKHTVGWSTYLNGMQEDYGTFQQELQTMGEHLSAHA